MTYGFLLLFAFVRTISYQNWFLNVDLYYLQLITIIAYHLNAHIMLLPYVICNYIWHMGSQNFELLSSFFRAKKIQEMCAIFDPLDQTFSPTCSNHYSRFIVVLFCEILKMGTDGQTWGRTVNMREHSDHYRPWLWVGLMDQYRFGEIEKGPRMSFLGCHWFFYQLWHISYIWGQKTK